MAPFQYDGYRNPYVGSITDLIRAPGEFRARAAELSGQANARAAEQSGRAWAGAVSDIGQSVAGAVQQATDPKRKLADLQVTEATQQLQDTKALKDLIRKTPKVDLGGGVMGYDVPTLMDAFTAAGRDPKLLMDHVGPINDGLLQMHAGRMATVKSGALALQAADNDPAFAGDFIDVLERNHAASPQQLQQFRAIAATREGVAKLTAFFAGPPKFENAAPGSSARNAATGVIVPGSQAPEAPKPFSLNPNETRYDESGKAIVTAPSAAPVVNPETERHNKEMERIANLTAGRQAAAEKETERHNRAIESEKTADKTDLTPAGLDAAALNYAKTGQLPPLGQGDKTTRKNIINRAAEMIPGLDIATAKADYGANQDTLKALTKQREALGAFESTALKNLDVFIAAASKVPDTGSPWLNKPIRALSESVLGGAELTAYNTARRTVIPEFAKILANPGLSGQLSDSARKEIEDVVSGSATLKQTIAAAKILKQDTENRRTSYDDQIAGIRERIKKGASTPTTPTTGSKTDPMGIR